MLDNEGSYAHSGTACAVFAEAGPPALLSPGE
jgi:hypothetical protein